MTKFFKKLIKIFFINIFIILTFTFFIEIFFGYWFDEDNFGPYMREHRMKNQRIEWTNGAEKKIYFYRRNYYGFRGGDIEPSEIQAVILGGSAVDERFSPDEYTITGFLNKKLEENNIKIKIINGGVQALSTVGMIDGFENWLFKLKNFSPKYILFYVGINEAANRKGKSAKNDGHDGHLLNPESVEVLFDTIKSKSILYDSIRIFKFKYLPRKNFTKYDGNMGEEYKRTFNFTSYKFAEDNYNLVELEKKLAYETTGYLNRIEELNKLSKQLNSIPIFITSLTSGGHSEFTFTMNNYIMKNCKIKKLLCIDLAKKIDGKIEYWYDGTHTSKKGSETVAKLIFEDLEKIIQQNN